MAWVKRSVRRQAPPANTLQARVLGMLLILLTMLTPVSGAAAADPGGESIRLKAGAQLFEAHCIGCHVGGGNVIRRGRTLKQAALERAGLADPEAIARIAAAGIGQMSGYGAVLGEEGAAVVGEWVWLQARAGWPRSPQMEPLP